MDEQQVYNEIINNLDKIYEFSIELDQIKNLESWKEQTIFKLFKTSKHILFCLLSNTEGSKYLNDTYVTELVLVGSLCRIIRDIYVQIAYLSSTKYTEAEMQLCWEHQIGFQKVNALTFVSKVGFEDVFQKQEIRLKELKDKLSSLKFTTKGMALKGKEEKLLSLFEIAELKGFNKDKFHNEFEYFSQFVHVSAFSNELTINTGIDLRYLAIAYGKLMPYYFGIVAESMEMLTPNNESLVEIKDHYINFIKGRWC